MSTSLFVNVVVLAGFIAVAIVGHFIFLAGSQSFLMNCKFAIRNPDCLLVLNCLAGAKDFDFINQGGNEISESYFHAFKPFLDKHESKHGSHDVSAALNEYKPY